MNIDIAISTPVLLPGESFEVKYRLLPNGSPVTVTPNKTNAPFTLNLAAGSYAFEFTLIKVDGSRCGPTTKQFTVKSDVNCLTFTGAVVAHNENGRYYYTLELSYVTAGPPDACSYIVSYTPTGGGAAFTQTYTTLPSSPIVLGVSTNTSYNVVVKACDCDGVCKVCYEALVPAAVISCTKGSYDGYEYYYAKPENDRSAYGNLEITVYAFPNPMCATVRVIFQQQQLGANPVGPADAGDVILNLIPGQTVYNIPIHPNTTMLGAIYPSTPNSRYMTYRAHFIDCCGTDEMTYGQGVYHF